MCVGPREGRGWMARLSSHAHGGVAQLSSHAHSGVGRLSSHSRRGTIPTGRVFCNVFWRTTSLEFEIEWITSRRHDRLVDFGWTTGWSWINNWLILELINKNLSRISTFFFFWQMPPPSVYVGANVRSMIIAPGKRSSMLLKERPLGKRKSLTWLTQQRWKKGLIGWDNPLIKSRNFIC